MPWLYVNLLTAFMAAAVVGMFEGIIAQIAALAVLLPVVAGRHSLSEGRAAAISATRALAKRQRTFFRRDPRINWITWDPNPKRRLDRAYTVLEEMA